MSEAVPSKKSWIDLIDESVNTRDDTDIGDIDAVSRDFVVVKRGFVNVHYYYIPVSKVEGWDGNVLWLKVTEDEVKRNYEKNTLPEPWRYFVKDYPGYTTTYPELTVLAPRYTMPVYTALPRPEEPVVFKCDLCEAPFRSEDSFPLTSLQSTDLLYHAPSLYPVVRARLGLVWHGHRRVAHFAGRLWRFVKLQILGLLYIQRLFDLFFVTHGNSGFAYAKNVHSYCNVSQAARRATIKKHEVQQLS